MPLSTDLYVWLRRLQLRSYLLPTIAFWNLLMWTSLLCGRIRSFVWFEKFTVVIPATKSAILLLWRIIILLVCLYFRDLTASVTKILNQPSLWEIDFLPKIGIVAVSSLWASLLEAGLDDNGREEHLTIKSFPGAYSCRFICEDEFSVLKELQCMIFDPRGWNVTVTVDWTIGEY